jgi:hypothetical protein
LNLISACAMRFLVKLILPPADAFELVLLLAVMAAAILGALFFFA